MPEDISRPHYLDISSPVYSRETMSYAEGQIVPFILPSNSLKESLDPQGQITSIKAIPFQALSSQSGTEALVIQINQRHLFGALTFLSLQNHLPYTTCTSISTAKSPQLYNRAPHSSLHVCNQSELPAYAGNPKSLLLVMIYEAGKTQLYFQCRASAHNAGNYQTDRS